MQKVVSGNCAEGGSTLVALGPEPYVCSLVECPETACGNYVLVRRDRTGVKLVLGMGRVPTSEPSLNLAHIRSRGATLGANEVHLFGACELE
jgi:hypothetical protein